MTEITGEDVSHIRNVLRMKPGEEIEVSDGTRCFAGQIESLSADAVRVRLKEERQSTELPVKVTLYQGLPKSDKLETIIQKCTELGAAAVVPVEMRRSVVKIDAKKKAAKQSRWQSIAESAAKQSKRTEIPSVSEPVSFAEAVADSAGKDVQLFCYEQAMGMRHTRDMLGSLKPGQTVGLWIGPEGGFEESEARALQDAGAQVITLGRRILRTETAGPAALAMLTVLLEP
ncbi:MAG: RsmE family RNA methyltransferase [Lachnospiraceae bacterium]